jgi:DNA transformation protein
MSLSDLPNIGPTLEALLNEHGIHTADDLRSLGAVEACRRLQLSGESCYNKLYALEGAIRGIRWHDLPKHDRAALKAEFDEFTSPRQ